MDERNQELEEILKMFDSKPSPSSENNIQKQSQINNVQSRQISQIQRSSSQTARPSNSTAEKDNSQPKQRRNHSAKRKTEKKCGQRRMIVIAVILVVVLSLAAFFIVKSCNKADELKGTWDFDGVTVYQFDGKGNGSLNLPSNRYEFTYEINENEVSIDFKNDNANDVAYTFSLEKDKLILIYNEDKATATYEMKRVE